MAFHDLGPFRLDTQDELLFRGSEPLALGRRAIALLRVLVERPGAVISKDALITAAWPHQAVEESNLTVQIAALRRILSEAPGGDRWIETMPRRGYRYLGPVITEPQTDRLETSRPVDAKPALSPVECEPAERRQITAMSCEMIGFKSRANVLDHLEDWGEAIEFSNAVSRQRPLATTDLSPDISATRFSYSSVIPRRTRTMPSRLSRRGSKCVRRSGASSALRALQCGAESASQRALSSSAILAGLPKVGI